ncbi:MAG: hypothetical protein CM1200mP5_4830 [Candidatus Pelagibacterales bacterium]|nr:MAG: hypothetical protein CM1200mP5_4830 [Pelagibacterales bacterium]
MPKLISSYVKFIDTICIKVGRIVMYGVFFYDVRTHSFFCY